MRRTPLLLLALATAAPGCTGRTSPIQIREQIENPVEGDGGAPLDSGFPIDSGVLDAGVVDTGAVDDQCRFYGDYAQSAGVSSGRDFYDGPAFLLNRDPVDVQLTDGDIVRLEIGRATLPSDFLPGRSFWLQFGHDVPQWQNTAIAFREEAPNDGPGRLRLAVWAFGDVDDFEFDFDSVDAEYGPDACEPADLVGCGPAVGMVLKVRGPAVAGAEIRPGEVQFFRTMEIGNGRSHEFVPFPECDGAPSSWFEGYISVF